MKLTVSSPQPLMYFAPPWLRLCARVISMAASLQVVLVGTHVPRLLDSSSWASQGEGERQWQRDVAAAFFAVSSPALLIAWHTFARRIASSVHVAEDGRRLLVRSIAWPSSRWSLPLENVRGVVTTEAKGLLLALAPPLRPRLFLHGAGSFPQRATLLALLQRAAQQSTRTLASMGKGKRKGKSEH